MFLQLHRETMSSGQATPSSGASSDGSEPRRCMVALHDYNPFHSGAPGRPPHEQLSFKKGDVMIAFGDMDVNKYYRVDLNGKNSINVFPSQFYQWMESELFLKSLAPVFAW